MTTPLHLRAAGVSLVLDAVGPQLPCVLHWGADLGPLDADALTALAAASRPPVPGSAIDAPVLLPVLPTEDDGWSGTPGISGHRAGAGVTPQLVLDAPVTVDGTEVTATASGGGLTVVLTLVLDEHGIVRVRTRVRNTGEGHYDLASVLPLLPVPPQAAEVLDLSGRWCRERFPQRSVLQHGTHLRAARRGRSGHDFPLLMTVGTRGFGFRAGETWSVTVAWSGDSVHLAERLPEGAGVGASVLGGGEALRPGEVRLAPGEECLSSETLFVWSGDGLDGASRRVHRALRSRPAHPRSERPLVLNIWEAVYFDHDLSKLLQLADAAASIGVERYVVDDGWFGSRRDDTSGLGDWHVSPDVWPDGLAPLFDHVRSLGMQVGLWFEPEMVNPDSDVVRAHPDWVLTPRARGWRGQLALDLAHPDAYAYLLERIDSVVGEYEVDFVKWDMNRDLHVAEHVLPDGTRAPGVRSQTLALYRLLDELRARHPRLEIESCASGGARVDLGVLGHTDRVWTSDCNDAVERQAIQRWTGLLLPPELMGAHVGPAESHTTGRVLSLPFRCATALFGHAGLEWDVTTCSADELDLLRRWSALYREQRGLLHGGDVVRADLDDPGALLHGVVAPDLSRALYGYVRLTTAPDAVPGRVRLPGLDRDRTYTVRVRDDLDGPDGPAHQAGPPPWCTAPVRLPGSVLTDVGLPMPVLHPASALLIEVSGWPPSGVSRP